MYIFTLLQLQNNLCFYVYTYYNFPTRACPVTSRCVDLCNHGSFCCRMEEFDYVDDDGNVSCSDMDNPRCPAMSEWQLVFQPTRVAPEDPCHYRCGTDLRDRVCYFLILQPLARGCSYGNMICCIIIQLLWARIVFVFVSALWTQMKLPVLLIVQAM